MPTNAVITGDNLLINGVKQSRQTDIKKVLHTPSGQEGDVILVLMKNLTEERVIADLAIPLAAWEDNKSFFRGFILFRQTRDKYWAAFMHNNCVLTALVESHRIKNFDSETECSQLEPGIEVKLMLKPRSESIIESDLEPRYRASLCIPDPEKSFYDLVDITNWAPKTRAHFQEIPTIQDIAESCSNGVQIWCMPEKQNMTNDNTHDHGRSFFVVRGKDRRSCIDGFNKIIQAMKMFEQLPGNKPRFHTVPEVLMDSISFTDNCPPPSNIVELQLTAHYTGTTIRKAIVLYSYHSNVFN